MFEFSPNFVSKDWVNLNPKTNENSIDIYYNEKTDSFSLGPIFNKSLLPEVYDFLSKTFKLKLSLQYLHSVPDFLDEIKKIQANEEKMEKPQDLEDYAKHEVFLKKMALALQEDNNSNERERDFFGYQPSKFKSLYSFPERKIRDSASDLTTKNSPNNFYSKESNFKEKTLKVARQQEEQLENLKDMTKVISLKEGMEKYKDCLCNNASVADLQRYRVDDKTVLGTFDILNKNETALFYEFFQKAHKIKPVFTFSALLESQMIGKLNLEGKTLLQFSGNCRKEIKKCLCQIALEIFCPLLGASPMAVKRKSSQIKSFEDPFPNENRKKLKISESIKSPSKTKNNETISKEKEKEKIPVNCEQFMSRFENINEILGKNNSDFNNNKEQNELFEPQLLHPFYDQDDFFNASEFLPDFNGCDIKPYDEPFTYKDKEKEYWDLNYDNYGAPLYAQQQSAMNNEKDNEIVVIQNNKEPVKNRSEGNPKKNSITSKYHNSNNFSEKFSKKQIENPGKTSQKNNLQKKLPSKPTKIAIEPQKFNEKNKPVTTNLPKDEEELEEEIKKIIGNRVVSIKEILKDLGNSQKDYPIEQAANLLEKLKKLHSLKNEVTFKDFKVKMGNIMRYSIKNKDKEICFAQNEQLLVAKYFCHSELFLKIYGYRCTINEILIDLSKKGIRKPYSTTSFTQINHNNNGHKNKHNTINSAQMNPENPELTSLLDDIDGFQYSTNTINNNQPDDEKSDYDDYMIEDLKKKERIQSSRGPSKKHDKYNKEGSSSQRDRFRNLEKQKELIQDDNNENDSSNKEIICID